MDGSVVDEPLQSGDILLVVGNNWRQSRPLYGRAGLYRGTLYAG